MEPVQNNNDTTHVSASPLRARLRQWTGRCGRALGHLGRALWTFLKAVPRSLGSLRRWLLTLAIVAIAVVLAFVAYTLWNTLHADDTPPEVTLQPTLATIEDVRPRGRLYVCTAVVEDFVTRQNTEMHVGIFPEKHSCVQVLKQKVSFRIDLDKVRYTLDTLNVVIVELPPIDYVASTQESPFMSDDEDYWREALPSTNGLKRQVENKIRRRFDTEANRKKARRYAEEAVSDLFWKLGYETQFVPHIDKKKE